MPGQEYRLTEVAEETGQHRTAGGYFGTESIGWDAGPGESDSGLIVLPLNVGILAAHMTATKVDDGDKIALDVSPDKVVGALPGDVAAGVSVIPMPATMKAAYQAGQVILGMRVTLDDGTNADSLGILVAVDEEADTFTTKFATANAFAAATPTLVKMTASMSPGIFTDDAEHKGWIELQKGEVEMSVGLSKIGANVILAGEALCLRFYNTAPSGTKRIVVRLEFTY